jgi:hypothetical protein
MSKVKSAFSRRKIFKNWQENQMYIYFKTKWTPLYRILLIIYKMTWPVNIIRFFIIITFNKSCISSQNLHIALLSKSERHSTHPSPCWNPIPTLMDPTLSISIRCMIIGSKIRGQFTPLGMSISPTSQMVLPANRTSHCPQKQPMDLPLVRKLSCSDLLKQVLRISSNSRWRIPSEYTTWCCLTCLEVMRRRLWIPWVYEISLVINLDLNPLEEQSGVVKLQY